MPITLGGLTGAVAAGLAAGGMVGQAVPQLAAGVSAGLMIWIPQLTVTTVDAGTLGVGTGLLPFAVPAPLIIGSLLAMYPANGHLGPMAPLEATGLGTGIATGFAQGLMTTNHPTVGTGTGVARVVGPPAFPSLVAGFGSVGITGQGSALKANAISSALVLVLQSFTVPIPIVGAASPTGSSGVGVGKIL